MNTRAVARFCLWLVLTVLAAVLAARSLPDMSDTRAQSSVPTYTPTPTPQTPTDTPTPSAPTDTPTPFAPTDTPIPPTNTPTPIPPPPTLGSILIEPLEGVAAVDTDIVVSVVFTMPQSMDLYAATWDWGDGSSSNCVPNSADCTVVPEAGIQSTDYIVGRVTGSHTYGQPGIYAVQLTVVDIFGQFDTATFEFVVVYDPDGGFVTGGGWINSPPGAYVPDPTLTGKATFGFVSEYQKGADTPTGNTEFQFNAGDLNFHADSYDWLVVERSGSWAVLQGLGRLNGELDPDGDPYRFTLFAGDGSPDTFSVSIWYEYEHFGWYYDLEAGVSREGWHVHTIVVYGHHSHTFIPSPSDHQPIGGGSIEVHAAKEK